MERYEAHYGAALDVDVCHACNALWFDQREALRLTPDSTLRLIESMQARKDAARAPALPCPACPRCLAPLQETFDRVKAQVVSYFACAQGCGRAVTFLQFLREKQFVRDATAQELAALKASVKQVDCSSCGAPVDLHRDTRCAHCHAPVCFLDAPRLGELLSGLAVPAAQPQDLAQAAADVARLLGGERKRADPISAGLRALVELLER